MRYVIEGDEASTRLVAQLARKLNLSVKAAPALESKTRQKGRLLKKIERGLTEVGQIRRGEKKAFSHAEFLNELEK